jgi:hypothetical protein
MIGSKQFISAFSVSLLSGSLWMSAACAHGGNNDRASFRDFRQQNSGMDRHAVRALFRETVQQRNDSAAYRVTSTNNSQIQNHSARHNNVPKSNFEVTSQNQLRHVRGQTTQTDVSENTIRLRNGLDLDLTSTSKNIILGKNLFADGG